MRVPKITRLLLSCDPPIIHGNLTCDTIFIQHNGLVKIGSVAPDAIHKNVKTFRENIKNFHFLAPEWAGNKSCLYYILKVNLNDKKKIVENDKKNC